MEPLVVGDGIDSVMWDMRRVGGAPCAGEYLQVLKFLLLKHKVDPRVPGSSMYCLTFVAVSCSGSPGAGE